MQQVPEITDVGLLDGKRVGAGCYQLLRYSMILLIMFCASSCSRRSDPGGNLQTVSSSSDKSSVEQVLRRGIPGDPLTLDPHVADDDYSFLVIRDLYEGLTAEDRSGLTTPGVASSWTIDRSGTVYTFKVRSNAYWSNGQRVVADEFVQGLRRAVDPQTASGSAALLVVIKNARDIIAGRKAVTQLGVTAVGDDSVRIELERPAPFILGILAQPIAAHLRKKDAQTLRAQEDANTSNGAYKLTSSLT